ncbi:MAG: DUF4846 domain-containing protein [Flavobacteriales bacterium]|nr:DUF4846 domain-containing protein [Flavobacteriales bacterium]
MALLFLLLMTGCGTGVGQGPTHSVIDGTTISTRFTPPAGFQRSVPQPGTFGQWLGNLDLLPPGTPVALYNGQPKNRQDVHAAVLDVPVGNKDLQQCADAVMRLRAEYLFAQGRSGSIHFNFTNGFKAEFGRWVNGERIQVHGNSCHWKRGGSTGRDHADLDSFLEKVFTYAGTLSLSKELTSAGTSLVQPGDVFIHGGSPGHAVIVMDVAYHKDGRQAFLIAQSYMPAQQIHVLKNTHQPELGAWFILGDGDKLHTPEWTFDRNERKRW